MFEINHVIENLAGFPERSIPNSAQHWKQIALYSLSTEDYVQ